MRLSRPIVRWHGGKWKLAPWIIAHLPPHRVYVEPYGGGGSVLLRKVRAYAEVYNDLDGEVVNLFRVVRDRGGDLLRALELTPFAREEFKAAYEACDEPIERARRLLIRAFMGFGSNGHNAEISTGFRANSNRSGTTPAQDWRNYPSILPAIVERLRGVIIENRDAIDVARQHDGPETLHYLDPPYLWETRSSAINRNRCYVHEMTKAQHNAMLDDALELKGMVVISGYASALYDGALKGWRREECAAMADGARKRREVLWISPRAAAALDQKLPLNEEMERA